MDAYLISPSSVQEPEKRDPLYLSYNVHDNSFELLLFENENELWDDASYNILGERELENNNFGFLDKSSTSQHHKSAVSCKLCALKM